MTMNENVNVCITPKGEKPVLHFSQFDNENIFTVTVLADDGESAAVLTGLDIEFRLRKTDSHVVTIAPESVADNVITFKSTEQMCACCGQNIASVVLMKDDMIVSTLDILVDIQRDILSGGLTSESDIRNLTSQIEQIVPEVVGDDYYNKQEVDDLLAEHTFDPTNYYNKIETDNLLSAKMDNIGYHGVVDDAAVISFTTDCNAPLDIIKGKITPVQSGTGTPSPDNVRPISGFSALNVTRTGKNLLDNVNYFPKSDSISNSYYFNFAKDLGYIPEIKLNADTAYTLSFTINSSVTPFNISVGCGNGTYSTDILTKTNLSNGRVFITFTPTAAQLANGNLLAFRAPRFTALTNATFTISDVQLELGTTATDYSLYNGQTATVNFGQTVYGGVVNVTRGKVNKTYGIVDLGTLWWRYYRNGIFYTDLRGRKQGGQNLICSNYPTSSVPAWTSIEDKAVVGNTVNSNIYVRDTDYSDIATFTTAMSGVQLVYELATPIEITTTPETVSSVSGDNNIFIDTGNMTEIAYFENAEDNLIKLIKAFQI